MLAPSSLAFASANFTRAVAARSEDAPMAERLEQLSRALVARITAGAFEADEIEQLVQDIAEVVDVSSYALEGLDRSADGDVVRAAEEVAAVVRVTSRR